MKSIYIFIIAFAASHLVNAQTTTVTVTTGPDWSDALLLKSLKPAEASMQTTNYNSYPRLAATAWTHSGYQISYSTIGGFSCQITDRVSGLNVLHVRNTNYNYDTVKVYNEDWTVNTENIGLDGRIAFNFYYPAIDYVYDQLESRRFFMYFNYQDIDTIAIAFKLHLTQCGYPTESYFKVSYNDSIYFDEPVYQVPSINFLK